MFLNYLPSVLTFDPPSKQTSLSVYRALKNAEQIIGDLETTGDADYNHRCEVALDDLKLMIGAIR